VGTDRASSDAVALVCVDVDMVWLSPVLPSAVIAAVFLAVSPRLNCGMTVYVRAGLD